MLFLVYQQPGPIIVLETQQVASTSREVDHKRLESRLENFDKKTIACLVT